MIGHDTSKNLDRDDRLAQNMITPMGLHNGPARVGGLGHPLELERQIQPVDVGTHEALYVILGVEK